VERGRNVADKSIEHERGEFQSLAKEEGTEPRLREAHGVRAEHMDGLSTMRDAKRQMARHRCRPVSRNVSRKSNQAGCYAAATSAKPKTLAKVAGRP
jgi:hypothetical protein